MAVSLLLLVSFISSPAFADLFPAAPHVYVQGSAELRIEPDTLDLSLAIQSVDLQPAVAKRKVDDRTRKLLAAFEALGIPAEDVSSASPLIGPWFEYQRDVRKFVGTRVYRQVDVTLRDLSRYSEVIAAVVAAEVDEIDSSRLSSSRSAPLLEQAQQAALADARARAERLATAAGQELGAAYSISEFDLRIDERYLRPARGVESERERRYSRLAASADLADEPFRPGRLIATATVYAIYVLEND
jgi:uncharacterized protein